VKYKFASVVLTVSLLVSGCGSTVKDSASKMDPTDAPTSVTNGEVSQSVKWGEVLREELVEFSVSKSDCSYDDGSLELLAKFTNIYSKEILAIKASAEIQDLFGENLMVLTLDSDQSLAPGKTVNVGSWGSSCFGLNNYDSDQLRLMEMINVSELTKVVIQVSMVAFKDGEILAF